MAKPMESVERSAEHDGRWISTSINFSGHQLR
jgi:hypothetical protein